MTNLGQLEILVGNAKLYINSYFILIDYGALKKHILTNIDDLIILTYPGAIFYESWMFFYLFSHWGQISDNWRSWLQI